MKRTLLLLTALFCLSLLQAQVSRTDEEILRQVNGGHSNEYFFTQSELVFEGRFIKVVDTFDLKGNGYYEDIYAILATKVNRVYKGDQSLTGDTIYTVCERTELVIPPKTTQDTVMVDGIEFIMDRTVNVSYIPPFVLSINGLGPVLYDEPSIFFFAQSDIPIMKDSKYASFRKYKFLHNGASKLHVWGEKTIGLNNLVFENREDLYRYMRQFEGYTVPEAASKGSSTGKSISQNDLPDCAKAAADSLHHEKAADIKKKAGTTVSTTP